VREIKSAWLNFEQTNSRGFNVVALVTSCRAYRSLTWPPTAWTYGWLNMKHRERQMSFMKQTQEREDDRRRKKIHNFYSLPSQNGGI
jgi:hypothetical protein